MNKICVECGKVFTTDNSRQKTCSPECALIRKNRQIKKYQEKHRAPPKKRTCVVCDKEFLPRANNQLTCCRECSQKWNRRKTSSTQQSNPIKKRMNLDKELARLHRYNDEHGTNVTYGMWRAMNDCTFR